MAFIPVGPAIRRNGYGVDRSFASMYRTEVYESQLLELRPARPPPVNRPIALPRVRPLPPRPPPPRPLAPLQVVRPAPVTSEIPTSWFPTYFTRASPRPLTFLRVAPRIARAPRILQVFTGFSVGGRATTIGLIALVAGILIAAVSGATYAFTRGPQCSELKIHWTLETSEGMPFPDNAAVCDTLKDIIRNLPVRDISTGDCTVQVLEDQKRRRRRQTRRQLNMLRIQRNLLVTIEVCPSIEDDMALRRTILSGIASAALPNYQDPMPFPRLNGALIVRTKFLMDEDLGIGYDDRLVEINTNSELILALDSDTNPSDLPDADAMCDSLLNVIQLSNSVETTPTMCAVKRITTEGVTFSLTTEDVIDPTQRTVGQYSRSITQGIGSVFDPPAGPPPDLGNTALDGLGDSVRAILRGLVGSRGSENDVVIEDTYTEEPTTPPVTDPTTMETATEGSGDMGGP